MSKFSFACDYKVNTPVIHSTMFNVIVAYQWSGGSWPLILHLDYIQMCNTSILCYSSLLPGLALPPPRKYLFYTVIFSGPMKGVFRHLTMAQFSNPTLIFPNRRRALRNILSRSPTLRPPFMGPIFWLPVPPMRFLNGIALTNQKDQLMEGQIMTTYE